MVIQRNIRHRPGHRGYLLVFGATISLLIGCTQRADKVSCEAAADRLVEIAAEVRRLKNPDLTEMRTRADARVDSKKARARFLKACPSAPQEAVTCIAEARTLADVQACQAL